MIHCVAPRRGRRSGEQVPARSRLLRSYRKYRLNGGSQAVSTVDFEPLHIGVPLREDPPGVFRVGDSRVLLELVLDAFKRGESAEAIVRFYRTLRLADVYAVISRCLADPAPFDEYLRLCDEDAAAVHREMDAAGMTVIRRRCVHFLESRTISACLEFRCFQSRFCRRVFQRECPLLEDFPSLLQ